MQTNTILMKSLISDFVTSIFAIFFYAVDVFYETMLMVTLSSWSITESFQSIFWQFCFTGVLNTFVSARSCQDTMSWHYLTPDIHQETVKLSKHQCLESLGWSRWSSNIVDLMFSFNRRYQHVVHCIAFYLVDSFYDRYHVCNNAEHQNPVSLCRYCLLIGPDMYHSLIG